ncbi:hypothetical protein KR054_008631, partial [Drosophila jambulina]
KRRNMKQYNHHHKKEQQKGRSTTTSSGSPPPPNSRRSMVDVADSSDEPRFPPRGNWQSGSGGRSVLAPQRNRDLLNTLPSDTDLDVDVEQQQQLGLDGAPIDENARAQLRAGDFQQLAQFPSLGGGHFTFGSEREWSSVAEGQTKLHTKAASGYFTLNLSRLNAGLQTIPFYKRMDYPSTMFTRQQIIAQEEAAERAEAVYQQRILQDANGGGSAKSRAPSAKSVKEAAPIPAAAAAAPVEPDELDELLAMTNTQMEISSGGGVGPITMPMPMPMVQPATPSSAASKNEVEQWLDSVLDE